MLVALWWTNHGDTLASGLCSQRVVGLVVGWVTGDTGTVARAPGQRGNPCAGMLPAPAEVTAPAAAPLGKASVSTRGGGKQRGVHVAPSIRGTGGVGVEPESTKLTVTSVFCVAAAVTLRPLYRRVLAT